MENPLEYLQRLKFSSRSIPNPGPSQSQPKRQSEAGHVNEEPWFYGGGVGIGPLFCSVGLLTTCSTKVGAYTGATISEILTSVT